MHRLCWKLALACSLGVVSLAHAESKKAPLLDVKKPAADVIAQVGAIQRDLADGKTYSEIDADQKVEVVAALERVMALASQGNGELPLEQQVEAFNDQQRVNTVLTKAKEDSWVVCRRERSLGSNLKGAQCMTMAQQRKAKEDGQRSLETL